jgi:cyclophilin family peptidyl-prolyl cis-trans isomerase
MRLKKTLLVFPLALLVLGTGCGSKKTRINGATVKEDSANANIKRGEKPQPDDQVAVIETPDYGNIVIELYPNLAPQMVARFKKLVQARFYDGTLFHRINATTGLIQGGDPLSRDNDPTNDGTGDSPYANVPGEFTDIPYERGTVGAARRGATPEFAGQPGLSEEQARNTANCQFFITLQPNPRV